MSYFSNIIGYEEIVKELEVILDIVNNSQKYEKLGGKIPAGILLNGSPGTGKTTMARDFLNACNRNKYIIRKNKSDGAFVDYIKSTIEEAIANAPSVVLLDDLDKFSNEDERNPDTEEYVCVQTMIDEARGKNVFFIATTNKIRKIPQSLTRAQRFDKIIYVDTPSLKDAEKIIKHYINDKPIVDSVDTKLVARLMEGKSCADLETVINEAAITAAYNNKNIIEMDDMIDAILKVIYESTKSNEQKTEYFNKLAAIHESGHCVINEVLEPDTVSLVSVANYKGGIGGVTCTTKNEDYFYDLKYMENRVISLLSGKAATEVCLGILDTGSSSDVDRAANVISRFVGVYCNVGLDKYDTDFYSEKAKDRKAEAVYVQLDLYYQKAKNLVFENKKKIEKMADELMRKGYLYGREITDITGKAA